MADQKKSKKCGRGKRNGQNAAYMAGKRHEKSHVKRIMRHLTRYGMGDGTARTMLMDYATRCMMVKDVKTFLGAA